jgi:hypothetical protein
LAGKAGCKNGFDKIPIKHNRTPQKNYDFVKLIFRQGGGLIKLMGCFLAPSSQTAVILFENPLASKAGWKNGFNKIPIKHNKIPQKIMTLSNSFSGKDWTNKTNGVLFCSI